VAVSTLVRNKKNKNQKRGRQVTTIALKQIHDLLGDKPRERQLLIEYLHLIQDKFHQISGAHVVALAELLKLAPAEVYEVATFYHHFDVVKDADTPPPDLVVRVCNSITCEMYGSASLISNLKKDRSDEIRIDTVPCVGRCHNAPVAIVGTNPIENATVEMTNAAIENDLREITPADYITYEQYIQTNGYKLYNSCVDGKFTPESVIESLKESNLRGLGGAGFPTGMKWEILRKQSGTKLIAVNIDEGEPGTFKDRYYLERDPHRFLEGTLIAAWAIEAKDIYIYLRDEYAGCRKILEKEIAELNKNKFKNISRLHLRRGAGAYICGEESAMIESIEGKRGMPRLRPPYVAEVGLFGQPTLEHNMETLYFIRDILEKGANWFTDNGRNGRQGLRSFSVSGRINKPGVHLAPAGITVRELIDEYCDGMRDGHEFYGYFPGGASGGILPASLGDIPLDFDTLNEYGCFIGSAAIIILSNHDKAKELALNAMRFFEEESCGQCTPCRVGTAKAVKLMEQESWDTELLEELSTVMADASICGLGQAAPNPLRCAIKYFPEEF